MTSEVQLCNMALSHIRGGSINSLTESSIQAQKCKLFYDTLRDSVLKESPWKFANKVVPLTPEFVEPYTPDIDGVFDWAYSYQYPNDCLHIDRVLVDYEIRQDRLRDNGGQYSHRFNNGLVNYRATQHEPFVKREWEYDVQHIRGRRVIVTNESEMWIQYRCRVEDVNLFPISFQLALSHLIASYIATSIVGEQLGSKLKAENLELYQAQLASAIVSDINQEHCRIPDSEFVNIRDNLY